MKKNPVFLILVALLFGSAAEAAGRGKPLVSTPLRDGADLAQRIRTDPHIFAVYGDAFRQLRPDLSFSGREDMAQYVETLAPCHAQGTYTVTRLLGGAVSTRVRAASEAALCDPSGDGLPVLFLHCGNVVRKNAPAAVREQRIAQGGLIEYRPLQSDVDWGSAFRDCPDESTCGQWHRTGRAVIYGAAGVGAAALLPGTRIKQAFSSSSTNSVNNANSMPDQGGPVNPGPDPPSGGGPANPAPDPLGGNGGGPVNPNSW
jgi:hypothetical protein